MNVEKLQVAQKGVFEDKSLEISVFRNLWLVIDGKSITLIFLSITAFKALKYNNLHAVGDR